MAKSSRKKASASSKSAPSKSSRSKSVRHSRSATRRHVSPVEETRHDSERDSTRPTITESLRNKRKKKGDGQSVNDLDAFKDAARRFACTYSPYINWSRVLTTGLERDEVIEDGCRNIADKEPERSKVLELYDLLLGVVPDALDLLREVVDNEAVDELMNLAASGLISNDIRGLKSRILDWSKVFLDIQEFIPPIPAEGKKVRGWYHTQLARLLCTPVKLDEYDKNPAEFCARVRENSICIDHRCFPSCFYSDAGVKASKHRDFVCEDLLLSTLLAKVWVDIFLGHTNAETFADNPNTKFRVLKKGKAYQYGITEVTYRSIAYASLLMRHSLSSSTDWWTDDGAVVKRAAFDAVVALFEDPKYIQEEWNLDLLNAWNTTLGWLLPSADAITGLESDDDEDCSLNMIQTIVQRKKQAAASTSSQLDKPTTSPPSPNASSSMSAAGTVITDGPAVSSDVRTLNNPAAEESD
ncbi:hypothetical protein K435DRAFT_869396 [Dendrothele bispora CBS 962.96]|uniref:Uncharacterized protein n=1 Tax=Dendrothele bispora (strain CBS 962.96) TaxID=1314807 RepID=A0A4S8L997_DENBC|nr:hypothetical protein K435DRAFT_869396 [Dendrothele bispora CBS 962.96]